MSARQQSFVSTTLPVDASWVSALRERGAGSASPRSVPKALSPAARKVGQSPSVHHTTHLRATSYSQAFALRRHEAARRARTQRRGSRVEAGSGETTAGAGTAYHAPGAAARSTELLARAMVDHTFGQPTGPGDGFTEAGPQSEPARRQRQ